MILNQTTHAPTWMSTKLRSGATIQDSSIPVSASSSSAFSNRGTASGSTNPAGMAGCGVGFWEGGCCVG